MTDAFGNFVIQKILEKGQPNHKEEIYKIMKGNIVQLSMEVFGCRVV